MNADVLRSQDCYGRARDCGQWEWEMAQLDAQAYVLEEWQRLPDSRRVHATDAVAFAYRLLREHPALLGAAVTHERVVSWLLAYAAEGGLGPL